jgi:putative peptidoglycan lipid II flippase
MLKSSGAMSVATMASRVLGLARETVYAGFMGDSWQAGAFKLAFMVPNLFRRLLGEGALTAAFIPVFKEKEKTAGEMEMWRAANAVLCALVVSASIAVALAMVAISILLRFRSGYGDTFPLVSLITASLPFALTASVVGLVVWIAPARRGVRRFLIGLTAVGALAFVAGLVFTFALLYFDLREAQTLLMLELLRVMFPYVLLVCVAALFMGMLNARGHFFVPALGATLLNLVMIASVAAVVWLKPRFGERLEQQLFGLAIGIVIAGLAQAGFQWPWLRAEGFRPQWISPWKDPTVHRVVTQMLPGTLGVAAYQLNVLITQGFAFSIDGTVVASFDYAVRLMELPQGVFGISLATYLLPTLSGLAAEKKYPEFRSTLRQGMSWLVFVNLLASVLLFFLAEPMVRLLFQHGKFDPSSTARAAGALMCLAPGLLAFSLVNILARAFYALGDTMTPMRVSVFSLAVNAALALALVFPLRQKGLGVANTCSAILNFGLLLYALRRKIKTLDLAELQLELPAMLAAGTAAGLTAWGVEAVWNAGPGHANLLLRLGEVFVPIVAASTVYLALASWLKVRQARELIEIVTTRLRRN